VLEGHPEHFMKSRSPDGSRLVQDPNTDVRMWEYHHTQENLEVAYLC